MNTKILLAIAVLTIGIFVMPQTVALFAGQHDWYDTTQPGNQVLCSKCHADIAAEMSQPGNVNAIHKAQSSDGGCEGCHIIAPTQKEGLTKGPGGQFHAAAAPACLDCHGGTGPGLSALEIVNGPEEVHRPFINESINSKFLKGANEACISCHTHVKVNATWSRATTIAFDAIERTLPDGSHTWNVTNFNATGVNVTTTSG